MWNKHSEEHNGRTKKRTNCVLPVVWVDIEMKKKPINVK